MTDIESAASTVANTAASTLSYALMGSIGSFLSLGLNVFVLVAYAVPTLTPIP